MDEQTKKKYLIIAKSHEHRERINEANQAIMQAIQTCKMPAVSFSFGKDSLVCVDLARKIAPDILILNIDRGEGGDIQEAIDIYSKFAYAHNLNFHRVKTPRSIMQIYREAGGINVVEKKEITVNLMRGFVIANKRFKIDCAIMGLRAEESNGRKQLLKYGTFHEVKQKYRDDKIKYKCKPVLNWRGEDIWAYIISNNLPYLSFYDRAAKFSGYENARYSNWAGSAYKERGRFSILKYTMPELFNRFAVEFPEIREW
jgi:3'-phosphoadenosine 5'-phosphosulfate sulfotransferase (PAPS reductase)/FAD synthetase